MSTPVLGLRVITGCYHDQPTQQAFPCSLGAKNEGRESKTVRKMVKVKQRGGGGEERKETLVYKPRDFENRPLGSVMREFVHRHLVLSSAVIIDQLKLFGLFFPSFPSPSPLFHFFALVSFLARPKPRIPFVCLSVLRNQTETLATQARL